MIERDLTPEEINEVLTSQCYAHLGFVDTSNTVKVLPITYVYEDNRVYSFSTVGDKIQSMRSHPNVCVQVEQLQPPDSWKSIQLWGKYKEVEQEKWEAIERLIQKFWSHSDKQDVQFTPLRDFETSIRKDNIIYQIEVESMVGKYGVHNSRFV